MRVSRSLNTKSIIRIISLIYIYIDIKLFIKIMYSKYTRHKDEFRTVFKTKIDKFNTVEMSRSF